MKKQIAPFLFFLALNSSAQNNTHQLTGYKELNYTPTNRDHLEKISDLEDRYNPVFENKAYLKDYVKETVDSYEYNRSNGEYYDNWDEASAYINKVMRGLLKDKWTESLQVIIVRDPEVNAFMDGTGFFYVNAGLLARVSTEAELAAVLGHEYGHYLLNHSPKNYINFENGAAKMATANTFQYPGFDFINLYTAQKVYSQTRTYENEADAVSFSLMQSSNYSLDGILAEFNDFIAQEKKETISKKRFIAPYYRDHPSSAERLSNAQKVAKQSSAENRKDFIVDESLFNKIKKQANDECIHLELVNFDFEDVIESCYKQLLLYPNDEYYLFYLNEGIRRFLLQYPKETDNNFITGQYNLISQYVPKETLPKVNLSKHSPKLTSTDACKLIQYQYKSLLFNNNKKELSDIPSNSLANSDTLGFVTYKEAQDFFVSCQEKLNQGSVNFTKHCLDPKTRPVVINSQIEELNSYNLYNKPIDTLADPADVFYVIPLTINTEVVRSTFFPKVAFSSEDLTYNEIVKSLKSALPSTFRVFDIRGLEIPEKVALYNFLCSIKSNGITTAEINKFYDIKDNMHNDMYKQENLHAMQLYPEISAIIEKYHLYNLIFLDVNLVETAGFPVGKRVIAFSNYYLNFKGNNFCNQYFINTGVQSVFKKNDISTEGFAQMISNTCGNFVIDINRKRKN